MTPAQDSVLAWVRECWPDRCTLDARALKLAEEAGEVAGAATRMGEGRGSKHHLAIELAQVVICAKAVAEVAGIDLDSAVAVEWRDMQSRSWE